MEQSVIAQVMKYDNTLRQFALSLTLNADDAEDLYQETWLRVVRHIDQYCPDRAFEPWLTKICVNTYRSVLRRLARHPLLNFRTNEEQEAFFRALPAPEDPDYGHLYQAVDNLPEKLRLAVILFYFEGMDVAGTAYAVSFE